MDKKSVHQFIKACMSDYAEGQDIPWDMDPDSTDVQIDGDSDFDCGFRPVIIRSALTYIKRNREVLWDHYDDMKPRVRTKNHFEFCLLVEVAGSKFRRGYTHSAFIKFLAWVCFLAFRFYEDGYKDFPKAAIGIISEAMCYFTEGTDSFIRQGGFPGLVREAGRLEYESIFETIRLRRPGLNGTF